MLHDHSVAYTQLSCNIALPVLIVSFVMQMDVPTFEFIDLPGLQTVPEYAQQTSDLLYKYLNMENTLVLCVISATNDALDGDVAFGMVKAVGKLDRTILAITKSDKLKTRSQISEQIFERLLRKSDVGQYFSEVAGCVAVSNRFQKQSLATADAKEAALFKKMLQSVEAEYASEDVQKQLRDNSSVHQLILKLDNMYHLPCTYLAHHELESVNIIILLCIMTISFSIGSLMCSQDWTPFISRSQLKSQP